MAQAAHGRCAVAASAAEGLFGKSSSCTLDVIGRDVVYWEQSAVDVALDVIGRSLAR